ncbi:MAG: glycosyltransferase, partial [Pyrinomonadaceae bacterium]
INSSQKVENLREAVLHVATKSEVLVFVDSDARPGPNWLRDLVSPLRDRDVGAATGYRWFIAKRPSFAAALLSCWNASIASALGPNTASNFCWGGSTAVRWDTFEALKIREKWLGTVSDDFAVTRIMSEAGLPIVFVPQALTASIDDCSLREMLEFTTRQVKITRVYQPDLWLMSFLGSGLFCFVMLWSLAIIFLSPRNDLSVWIAILTVVIVSTLSVGKAYLRLKAVRTVLKNYEEELQKQTLSQLTLWLLTPFIFLANSVAALFSRRMTWRGIGYVMNSPSKTTVMGNSNER